MKRFKRKIAKLSLVLAKLTHSKNYMKAYNRYLRISGMEMMGDIKFIHPSVYIDSAYADRIHVGSNCVISINSVILVHDYSVECGMTSIGEGNLQNEKKIISDIYIGNNVFIGAGCIVLPGTHIGDNCVIGAGTVCSGRIPENSVVVGEKWKVIANTMEWIQKKKKYIL